MPDISLLSSSIAIALLAIALGIAGLTWSADRFVGASAAMAKSFGVTPLIIGLTIVSLGTSAPEIMVSINAALDGAGDLAVGNAIGSNIANMGLVLGVTTLVAAIPVKRGILTQEIPILLGVSLVAGGCLYDAHISQIEGFLLALLLAPVMIYLIRVKKGINDAHEAEDEEIPNMSRNAAAVWFIVGLAALVLSSEVLVWGARNAAEYFSVSPLIIGLTVIAVGTSLPELAASVMSAIKGHHDIAIGNVVGSNIFNLLAVMSIPGIISQTSMESFVFSRDYMVMLGLTLFIAITTALALRQAKPVIGKLVGSTLLIMYLSYYLVVFDVL